MRDAGTCIKRKQLQYQTVMTMNSSVLLNITPFSPLKINRRFGGTCLLHLHGRTINQARNQHEVGSTFQRKLAPPFSRSKIKPRNQPETGRKLLIVCFTLLAVCYTLICSLAYSSALKMEATCFSKTALYPRIQNSSYPPLCENLKSYTVMTILRRRDQEVGCCFVE
jgi:hypothetical protein